MRAVKRISNKRKAALKAVPSSYSSSAIWQAAGLVVFPSLLCGGAMLALSFLSFIPGGAFDGLLSGIYQAYSAPGLAASRIAAGEKIQDENIFGLLQVAAQDYLVGRVAGAVELKE